MPLFKLVALRSHLNNGRMKLAEEIADSLKIGTTSEAYNHSESVIRALLADSLDDFAEEEEALR